MLFACMAITGTASGGVDEARTWIQRMNAAVTAGNYQGVLVRQARDRRAVLRIVHRMRDGHMQERVAIIPTDEPPPGREFIRHGSDWYAYAPDQRVRLHQTRHRGFGFLPALNGLDSQSLRHYQLLDEGMARMDGLPAQRISLLPGDELRYGYRFWLDPRSALPLKSQLITRAGAVIADITFLSLTTPTTIGDEQLRPEFDTTGFRTMNGDVPFHTAGITRAFTPRAELLPAGFHVARPYPPIEEAKAPGPRTRFLVSDGIAWVSVFVEQAKLSMVAMHKEGSVGDAMVMLGAQACYVAQVEGFTVTVVGEVPAETAKRIAAAMRAN